MQTPDSLDGKLAKVIAPIAWKFQPATNLSNIEALPARAKERETKKAADTFASTGRNVFVHYVTPVLDERRTLLLASSTTKKKYTKTAPQLWQSLEITESFFWNEAARQLRLCMKEDVLSPKGCLIHGGRLCEKKTYVWHAEIAVAAYLDLPPPQENDGETVVVPDEVNGKEVDVESDPVESTTGKDMTDNTDVQTRTEEHDHDSIELLDTLPDRFEYDQKMLYSHFARYDYDEVRKAEGKHQTAMLRQLADLLDKTGKTLFYYYAVPRLCKQCYPPTTGETVTSKAAEVWRFLPGSEKAHWLSASARLKKQLGDGDVAGLEVLQLDSLDEGVLRLHTVTQKALDDPE